MAFMSLPASRPLVSHVGLGNIAKDLTMVCFFISIDENELKLCVCSFRWLCFRWRKRFDVLPILSITGLWHCFAMKAALHLVRL